MRLHFLCFPKDEIEVRGHPNGGDQLLVTDWSLYGGARYRLVCQTLVELGGACPVYWGEPLRLPLTEAYLRHERRWVAVASVLVTLTLALVAIGVLGVAAFLVWKVVELAI